MLLNWVMDHPEGLLLAFCNILHLHPDMGVKTTHIITFYYSSERCFGKGDSFVTVKFVSLYF